MKSSLLKTLLVTLILTSFTSCAYLFVEEDEEPEAETQTIQKVDTTAVKVDGPMKVAETNKALEQKANAASTTTSGNVKQAHKEVEQKLEEMTVITKPNTSTSSAVAKANSPSQLAPVSQTVTSFGRSISPEVALGWLQNGNLRFVHNRLRKDGQSLADVKKSIASENPHTVILTTSDSRVIPEIIFDQKIGEIHVVRSLGLGLDQMTVASIEYAVSQLGVRHIMILGNTYSDVIKSAMANDWSDRAGSENLTALYKDIKTQISVVKQPTNDVSLEREAWANALGTAEDLTKRSGLIALFLKEKKIKISPVVYKLDEGVVQFQ